MKRSHPFLPTPQKKTAKKIVLFPDFSTLKPKSAKDKPYCWKHIVKQVFKANDKYPWSKKESIMFWRGGPTDQGRWNRNPLNAKKPSPRNRIVKLSKKALGKIDAEFTLPGKSKDPFQSSIMEQIKYKYQIALDGNICTFPGYQWRLLSNCTVFKQQSNDMTWFYRALKPYKHYIPVKHDLSDLKQKIKWADDYPNKAKKIAKNGMHFAKRNLMPVDICLYIYLLIQKYASLQNEDVFET